MIREQFITNRRFGATVYCTYDEFSGNILENQVLHAAILLCQRFSKLDALFRPLALLRHTFDGVSEPLKLAPQVARERIIYNRLNAHYRRAHVLAWIILAGLGVERLEKPGNAQVYSFLIDMNKLFEDFVERIVTRLFPRPAYAVATQEPVAAVFRDLDRGLVYARMVPDLRVTRVIDATTLPVDAKYKRYDAGGVSAADLYQLSMYGLVESSVNGRRRSALIYPSERSTSLAKRIGLRGGPEVPVIDLHVIGVHVPSLLMALVQPGPPAGQAAWLRNELEYAIAGARSQAAAS